MIQERDEREEQRRQKQEELGEAMKTKFEDASFWSRQLIFAMAISFVLVVAYTNDAFSGVNLGKQESLLGEIFSLKNLRGMSRELTWFSVVYTLYLLAKSYNDYLDREEEK